VVVHLYGQCADMDSNSRSLRVLRVPILEMQRGFGATTRQDAPADWVNVGIFLQWQQDHQTTGGGMLVSHNARG